ncbi:MAG TPA: hypothetical protein VNG33_06920, partial [Polyangiaceae bacterium]|nr:hypothetical protein [Polyangiaceae bacterium]
DSCNPTSGVVHAAVALGTACSDGNPCNGSEQCDSVGHCQAGVAPALADGNPCTSDSCSSSVGVKHSPVPAGTSCADANLCNGAEVCDAAGACKASSPLPVDDGNPCTDDSCDQVTGVHHNPVAAGTSCADSDHCNGDETCSAAGVCVSGTTSSVDDGNPCTQDVCDPSSGVKHTPLPAGSLCDNGNVCDGVSTCNGSGVCVAGNAPTVDDANPCTTDDCDPATGVRHTPVAAGTSCSDGNACNGAETCGGDGHCAAGVAPAVDDGNPCTLDSCDSVAGIKHAAAPAGASCADSNPCNGVEACDGSGTCKAGTSPSFDDGNPCTVDSCDPTSGARHVPTAAGSSCADANHCNGEETCSPSGVCAAAAPPLVDDGNACTQDSCDPASGVQHSPLPAGASCGAGNACRSPGVCDAGGACNPGAPNNPDDGNPCTIDSCDPTTGVVHTPVAAGTGCSDGNACNGNETCSAGGNCQLGTAPTVDDGNPCTADHCDAVVGVSHTPVPAGTHCGDTNLCNGVASCDGSGSCSPGAAPSVDDGNPCTFDSCDPALGVRHDALPEGTACGDSDACNGVERCAADATCQPGTPPVSDDKNPCTIDRCEPTAGVVHENAPVGTSCGDGNVCHGAAACDGAGACQTDAPPALLTLESPASGTLTRAATIAISGTAQSSSGVTISVAGASITTPGGAGPQPFSVVVPLVEGENPFSVQAVDQNGCSASSDLVVIRDSAPPTLTLDVPGSLTLDTPVQVTASTTDSRGVAEVRFSVSLHGSVVDQEVRTSAPYVFTLSAPSGAAAGDVLLINAEAVDQAGNSAQGSRTVVVTADAVVIGTVLSDASGQPLPGASVRVQGVTAATRADGRYAFGIESSSV